MRGPQYRPQNTIVLLIGTPKRVPLILGNCQIGRSVRSSSNMVQTRSKAGRSRHYRGYILGLNIGVCIGIMEHEMETTN